MRGARWRVIAALAALLTVGCTANPPAPVPPRWQVATPPGMTPATVAAGDDGVLVGGSAAAGGQQPRLAVRQGSGWQDIPAVAGTAYGGMATIVHGALGADGQVTAIGTATGGAHLNPRWSAWTGTTGGVVEEPQTVETFGGPDAGGITGVVSGPDPMVVGTWVTTSGVIGVATWEHRGPLWLRRPSPAVLGGAPAELLTATATAALGNGVLITGLATSFVGGVVHQQAVVWVSGADPASWTRLDLDSSAQDSAATDVACAGDSCVVVGRTGDGVAAWSVTGGAGGAAAAELPGVPDVPLDHYLGQPRVGYDGAATVIAPGSGDLLLAAGDGSWAAIPAPAGEQRAVGVRGAVLYLLLRPATGVPVLYARDAT